MVRDEKGLRNGTDDRVEEKLGSRIARVTYEKVRKTRNNYSTDTS